MSKRILVVEDQPDNRQIIRDMLARLGSSASRHVQPMSAFGGKADIVTPERSFTRSARGYGATQAGNLRNTFAHPRNAIF
jgi:CheY-like chemotaxis protein